MSAGHRRSVLVTGSTSGIGRATALEFARRNYRVLASARDVGDENAQTLLVESEGLDLTLVELDVSDDSSVAALVEGVAELDVLVNNAGVGIWTPLEHATRAMARRQFEINLFGVVDLTHRLIPRLQVASDPAIINLGSIGSRIAFPFFGLYNASKFALEAYSLVLRVELRTHGIRVVCVEPGYVESDFYTRSLNKPAVPITSSTEYYESLSDHMDAFFHDLPGSSAEDVARAIVAAAEQGDTPARVLVGEDALMLSQLRAATPTDDDFYAAMLGDQTLRPTEAR